MSCFSCGCPDECDGYDRLDKAELEIYQLRKVLADARAMLGDAVHRVETPVARRYLIVLERVKAALAGTPEGQS